MCCIKGGSPGCFDTAGEGRGEGQIMKIDMQIFKRIMLHTKII
jgi:hypothetical protein